MSALPFRSARLLILCTTALTVAGCRPDPRVQVAQSPSEVYPILLDLYRYPNWLPPHFQAVSIATFGPDSAALLTSDLPMPGPTLPIALRLTETEPDRKVVLESPVGAAFPLQMTWTITPASFGSFVQLSFSPRGTDVLLEAPYREVFDAAALQTLTRLKEDLDAAR